MNVERLPRDLMHSGMYWTRLFAILNIEDIISRLQPYPIISIFVRCHPRDFFLFLLT